MNKTLTPIDIVTPGFGRHIVFFQNHPCKFENHRLKSSVRIVSKPGAFSFPKTLNVV